jgi:hypothetical protein
MKASAALVKIGGLLIFTSRLQGGGEGVVPALGATVITSCPTHTQTRPQRHRLGSAFLCTKKLLHFYAGRALAAVINDAFQLLIRLRLSQLRVGRWMRKAEIDLGRGAVKRASPGLIAIEQRVKWIRLFAGRGSAGGEPFAHGLC